MSVAYYGFFCNQSCDGKILFRGVDIVIFGFGFQADGLEVDVGLK